MKMRTEKSKSGSDVTDRNVDTFRLVIESVRSWGAFPIFYFGR